MNRFFSTEGRFFTVTSKMFDIAVITCMWLIGCIPIITILTSTASLYHTTVKCIRYDRGKATRDFVEAYKKNLSQGVPLTILYGIIGAAIGFMDYNVFFLSKTRTTGLFILAAGMLILTCVYLINTIWLVAVFSRFSNTLGKILRLNFVISIRFLARGVLMAAVLVLSVMCVLSSLPLVILFPALAMLLISYLAEPGLHKFMPKQEEDNGDWRYGFK